MASAIRSVSRVATPQPRACSSGAVPGLVKTLLGGIAAVACGLVLITAALTAAGWVVAVSSTGRADLHAIALTVPSERLNVASFATGMPHQPMTVMAFAPQSEPPAEPPAPQLPKVAALELPPLPLPRPPADEDDRIVTGSLGPSLPKLADRYREPAERPESREPPPPLPRARPQLASLAPPDTGLRMEDDRRARRTAIYDIAAKVVYLPGGERLEAHSGLGRFMDDPSSMRERNRGVTPPGTYDLTLRESLFHGVQAIRLTPVDEDAMFGRAGMLAHTYMLGPSGQSNGCVSFRDYPRFLRAYQRGEIDRLVVVPHLSQPPAYAEKPRVVGESEAVMF